MGKPEDDEFSLSTSGAGEGASGGSNGGRRENSSFCCRFIRLKCVLVMLLGISVFLSALFWLPPFSKLRDPGDPDLDPRYRGHTIVASFRLKKPVAFLKDNVAQLEADIYYELEAASTKVTVLSLEISPGSNGANETDVVFGVDPESKHSSIFPAEQSLIRSSFESFVIRQTDLRLTTSLFGQPDFFEVLKFPGGITVSPPQNAYPLQNVQILFNFTLNNSILQIQENFEDLRNQLKSGLHLTRNENLYIRLTNSRGSTVAPPATVQTSVVLAVGVPSVPRLKQLAQTIKDSPARNLGLNNTVFGKVKQVSLSSILQHSLGDAGGPAPAPSPLPHLHHHHHHHHHHHDHHHHETPISYVPPAMSPSYSPVEAPVRRPVMGAPAPKRSAPPHVRSHHAIPAGAPAPVKSYRAHLPAPPSPAPAKGYKASPPGCKFKFKNRHIGKSPAPSPSPTGVAMRPTRSRYHSVPPSHAPAKSTSPAVHRIAPSSPLPNVIFARVHPPSESRMDPEPPDSLPLIAPSTSSGGRVPAAHWVFLLLVALLLHHW